ncbi:hypothetical protein TNCV_1553201 [Trichonephila clavipes]|nr:hypothetical protein TNCV_1553201 [Trichonephila clavipes]
MTIGNVAAMLNGLLHSNDFERRRMTRCLEVLPTALIQRWILEPSPNLGKRNSESQFTFRLSFVWDVELMN